MCACPALKLNRSRSAQDLFAARPGGSFGSTCGQATWQGCESKLPPRPPASLSPLSGSNFQAPTPRYTPTTTHDSQEQLRNWGRIFPKLDPFRNNLHGTVQLPTITSCRPGRTNSEGFTPCGVYKSSLTSKEGNTCQRPSISCDRFSSTGNDNCIKGLGPDYVDIVRRHSHTLNMMEQATAPCPTSVGRLIGMMRDVNDHDLTDIISLLLKTNDPPIVIQALYRIDTILSMNFNGLKLEAVKKAIDGLQLRTDTEYVAKKVLKLRKAHQFCPVKKIIELIENRGKYSLPYVPELALKHNPLHEPQEFIDHYPNSHLYSPSNVRTPFHHTNDYFVTRRKYQESLDFKHGVTRSEEERAIMSGESSFTPKTSSYAPQTSSYAPQTPSYAPQTPSCTPQMSSYSPQAPSCVPKKPSYPRTSSSYTQIQSYKQPISMGCEQRQLSNYRPSTTPSRPPPTIGGDLGPPSSYRQPTTLRGEQLPAAYKCQSSVECEQRKLPTYDQPSLCQQKRMPAFNFCYASEPFERHGLRNTCSPMLNKITEMRAQYCPPPECAYKEFDHHFKRREERAEVEAGHPMHRTGYRVHIERPKNAHIPKPGPHVLTNFYEDHTVRSKPTFNKPGGGHMSGKSLNWSHLDNPELYSDEPSRILRSQSLTDFTQRPQITTTPTSFNNSCGNNNQMYNLGRTCSDVSSSYREPRNLQECNTINDNQMYSFGRTDVTSSYRDPRNQQESDTGSSNDLHTPWTRNTKHGFGKSRYARGNASYKVDNHSSWQNNIGYIFWQDM